MNQDLSLSLCLMKDKQTVAKRKKFKREHQFYGGKSRQEEEEDEVNTIWFGIS